MSDSDLSHINLRENTELYRTMLELTRYCKNCSNNFCIGGYNCKSGVCDKKYCICINDLNHGCCNNVNCNNIHLSKRGLKPFHDKIKLDRKKRKNDFDKNRSEFRNYDDSSSDDNLDLFENDSDMSEIDSVEQLEKYGQGFFNVTTV